ncbi:hypothetical protein ACLOAU_04340 [Niabella sp. CJ426]|uniref:hypothetical protein n=1 Tax=Niabella sp. CJ426 TaxID=3393740 RepID=UPI003D071E3D
MKTNTFFAIRSLIKGIEYPQAPIQQGLFAEDFAEQHGFKFNRLAMLTIEIHSIHQPLAGAPSLYETLIIGQESLTDCLLHICIRGQYSYLTVASAIKSTGVITVSEDYNEAILMKKLSTRQIEEIFEYIWNNMTCIEPLINNSED